MILPVDVAIEVLTFGAVVAVTVEALRSAEGVLTVRRRLGTEQTDHPTVSLLKGEDVRNPVLKWVQSSTSLKDVTDRQKLRKDLSLAGFDHASAPVWYVITRFALAVGLPLLFMASQNLVAKPQTGFGLVLWSMLLCAVGLVAPRIFVIIRGNDRRAQIEHEFPDALDLMVVCVEAGLGVESAFVRVGEEVRESHPNIAKEFERVSEQLRAGSSRVDALRAMADRTNVAALRSFVALVIQSESLGSSIAQTLRIYSTEMREHRLLKAEEKAMRIPVLMTVPLVVCILPVIITALLLPAIIDVMRNLLPALAGQH